MPGAFCRHPLGRCLPTKGSKQQVKIYSGIVQKHVPARPILRNALFAFTVGGTICTIGQVILMNLERFGVPTKDAAGYTSGLMIVIASVLTGLGFYDEIGRVGGMGSALPITGFANSIVSPAMEYKTEGYVLGVSARMFQVAGPVIVYGLLTAAIVAAIRLVLR